MHVNHRSKSYFLYSNIVNFVLGIMPVYWKKKLNSLIKSSKSDFNFRRRKSTNSLANPENEFQFEEIRHATSEIQFTDADDINADSAAGYASIGPQQQPLNEGVASTSTLGTQRYEKDDILTRSYSSPHDPNAVYSIPIKKNKTIAYKSNSDNDSLSSDEVVEATQLDDDYLSHRMPKDERIRNIDALQTLSLIMFDDFDRNRKISAMKSFNTKPGSTHTDHEIKKWTFSDGRERVTRSRSPVAVQFQDASVQTDNDERDRKKADRINFLEQITVRLIEELKNYQPSISVDNVISSKYPEDFVSWPIDTKYLTPLFNAYDKRLNEKDDVIQNYEKRLNDLKQQLHGESQQRSENLLHKEQNMNLAMSADHWRSLYGDAKVVIANNESIIKKQISTDADLQRKIQELKNRIEALEDQKKQLSSSVKHCQRQITSVREKNKKLRSRLEDYVPRKKYDESVTAMKKEIGQTKRKYADEIKVFVEKFELHQNQTQSLTEDIQKLRAANCQLEGQNAALSKMLRWKALAEQKTVVYEQQNEKSIQEFAVTQHYVDNIETVIQQIVAERDTYVKMAEDQQQETIRLMKTVLRGTLSKSKLEDKLKKYKIKIAKRNAQTSSKLERNKNIFSTRCRQYETEIKELHSMLEDRQEKLRSIDNEKRTIEKDLEMVWRIASMENKQFL